MDVAVSYQTFSRQSLSVNITAIRHWKLSRRNPTIVHAYPQEYDQYKTEIEEFF